MCYVILIHVGTSIRVSDRTNKGSCCYLLEDLFILKNKSHFVLNNFDFWGSMYISDYTYVFDIGLRILENIQKHISFMILPCLVKIYEHIQIVQVLGLTSHF